MVGLKNGHAKISPKSGEPQRYSRGTPKKKKKKKELKNRFDTLKDKEPSIEKMNTVLREAMDTIQNQTQKPTIEKSIEDTETENLDKKRKELRQ